MIDKLKPKSEFSRNVLTLMMGTTIAQAIPIAISPILTRIYTPEDFGLFALFIAISSIFGSIATARYELAIMLPTKDEDAINIFALGFIINSTISLILLILIIFFNDYLTNLLNNEDIKIWLYFIPITVFFTGIFNLLNYFNNRSKNYKDIANATIIKSIVLATIQLVIGFIQEGVSGLISGQIISQLFANIRLLRNIIKDKVLISKINRTKIITLAKKYKDFPKYSLTGILANVLAQNLTNILISSLYSISTLGFYSLVQRVLGMPSSLIGASIGQVFFQEATKEKNSHGNAINIFKATVKKLILIGLPFFTFLFFIIEDLFAFVFGEEWRIAGLYATILIPLFFARFIATAVSTTYDIFGFLKLELIWQVILFIGIMIILIFSNFYKLEFKLFIYIFTFYSIIMYIISLYITFKLVQGMKYEK